MKTLAAVLLLVSAAFGQPQAGVTFYKHVAPILYKECAPCHRPVSLDPSRC